MATLIDPRVAALLGHDSQLPPVSPAHFSRDALLQRFVQPPVWQPDVAIETWFRVPDPVQAAVLVPLVMRDRASVLLTQRTAHLRQHAGQISFPGGRIEPTDANAVVAALREAHEEVGLAPHRVEVLGSLPTYTTGTGFIITPVVGLIMPGDDDHPLLKVQPDADEVEEVFEVPLEFLMDPQHHQRRAFDASGTSIEFFAMPWSSEQGKEYFIWGATAAMLRNLYRFLSA